MKQAGGGIVQGMKQAVEWSMGVNIEKLKIGVIGLSENSGAAFVSVCLARLLAEIRGLRPCLVELNDSRLYDALSMGKHFLEREFYPFFCGIKNDESIRGKKNELYGVNWALWTPLDERDHVEVLRQLRLVNNISGNVVISILPKQENNKKLSCLKDMELIILVIDPLPSSLLAGHDLLCEVRLLDIPVIYIVNKMNRGVAKRELINYLKLKKLHYIPFIEGEYIYGAEYSCRQMYDVPHVKEIIRDSFQHIIRDISELL